MSFEISKLEDKIFQQTAIRRTLARHEARAYGDLNDEWAISSLNWLLDFVSQQAAEIERLKADAAEINSLLPGSWYADSADTKRFGLLIKQWQRLHEVNKQLQEENDTHAALRKRVDELEKENKTIDENYDFLGAALTSIAKLCGKDWDTGYDENIVVKLVESQLTASREQEQRRYAEVMEGHRAFETLFGEVVNGHDFPIKLSIAQEIMKDLREQVTRLEGKNEKEI